MTGWPAKLLPPSIVEERGAAAATRALSLAIADPARRRAESVVPIDLARQSHGEWRTIWANLPGFLRVNGRGGHYSHTCLPGWTYIRAEIEAAMMKHGDCRQPVRIAVAEIAALASTPEGRSDRA